MYGSKVSRLFVLPCSSAVKRKLSLCNNLRSSGGSSESVPSPGGCAPGVVGLLNMAEFHFIALQNNTKVSLQEGGRTGMLRPGFVSVEKKCEAEE